jgi:RecJ-like exonuclease
MTIELAQPDHDDPDLPDNESIPCPDCNGTGGTIATVCPNCSGRGALHHLTAEPMKGNE